MRTLLLISAIAGVFSAGPAASTGWRVTASYPAPAANARGIAYWAPYPRSVLCDGTPPRIYNLDNRLEYISLIIPRGVWGLGRWYQYGDLVVSNYENGCIYALTSAGSVVSSFRCPKDHPADLSSDPYYSRYVAFPDLNLALELTTSGSVLSSFAGPGRRLTAIEADYYTRGVLGDPYTHKVYFIGYGSVDLEAPVGLCYDEPTDEDPPYMYIYVVDAATNWVYEYNWSPAAAVTPASLGRVKALYW